MKNVYILLFFLFPVFNITAQPVITNSIVPAAGTSSIAKYMEVSNFDPGSAGANQTWDFGNLDLSNVLELNFQVLEPSSVLGNENFPTSDFVWYIPGFEIYEFYEVEADSISLVGGLNINDGVIDFMTIYTNPEDGLPLPLAFGDSHNYYSVFDQYVFGNLLATNDRTGTTTADAYGTITTPNGTYENVLRVKVEETSFGFTNTQYAWFDVNNFIPILVYETSSDPDSPPSVYFSDPNIIIDNIEEFINEKPNWKAWFNSSEEKIHVKLSEISTKKTIQLQVLNVEGKIISIQDFTTYEILDDVITIDLPKSINCETLIINLRMNGNFSSQKVSVCR